MSRYQNSSIATPGIATQGNVRSRPVAIPTRLPDPGSVGLMSRTERTGAAASPARSPKRVDDLTDSELAQLVERRLQHALPAVGGDIGVAVNLGVVTLSGSVDSTYERMVVLQSVQHVAGVRQVVNRLSIRSVSPAGSASAWNPQRQRKRKFVFGFVIAAAVAAAGFSHFAASRSDASPVAPLVVKAEFQNKPATGAFVRLYAIDAVDGPPVRAGRVAADGTVEWSGVSPAANPAASEFIVTAVWNRTVLKGREPQIGPNVLPVEYSKPSESPLRLVVADGTAQLNLSPLR